MGINIQGIGAIPVQVEVHFFMNAEKVLDINQTIAWIFLVILLEVGLFFISWQFFTGLNLIIIWQFIWTWMVNKDPE